MAQCVKKRVWLRGSDIYLGTLASGSNTMSYAAPNGADDKEVAGAIKITLLRSSLSASNRLV
jgi:hypothetical protein